MWIGIALFAFLLLGIGVVVYAISIYNALVGVKHQVEQAWANIDVLLRQRHDELPKLLDVVKGYGAYERDLTERLTALRTRTATGQGPDASRLAAEDALSHSVSQILLSAEAYPDLKANTLYLELERRISALEEQIAHRREFYNAAVYLNNVRRDQFPATLLASRAGLKIEALFVATEEEKTDIDVGASLKKI